MTLCPTCTSVVWQNAMASAFVLLVKELEAWFGCLGNRKVPFMQWKSFGVGGPMKQFVIMLRVWPVNTVSVSTFQVFHILQSVIEKVFIEDCFLVLLYFFCGLNVYLNR
jgi:hypothetical protein